MPMTNAELAAHFASKPPNEPACIFLLNADTGTCSEESLDLTTDEDIEDFELDDETSPVGEPHILQKC